MSIRRVTCPSCATVANVPVAMASIKCPGCGKVWNANSMGAAPAGGAVDTAASPANVPRQSDSQTETSGKDSVPSGALVAGLIGGGMFLFSLVGLVVFILNGSPDPSQGSSLEVEVEETIKPSTPEPYRVIKLPEDTRRRIYDDYRTVARTTIETPLALPQGTGARASFENMLQKTFDRELMHFAALHDISVDDVKEVIKEGDAKVWDDSPRSNAVRDGKRVYSKEMSEGWQKNPNRK